MADQNSEAVLRELYRKSMDDIRVYNPTDKDFVFYWDKIPHTVPAKDKDMGFGKGQMVMQRYLAEYYARHMKDQLINDAAAKKVKDMIAGATKDLQIKYESDPYERQKLYEMSPKTTDPVEIEKYYDIIWLGIERQFGIDEQAPTEIKTQDVRPIEEQILSKMDRPVKRMEEKKEEKAPEAQKYPINNAKKKLIGELE